ncbi:hypothetical protein ABW19_dt0204135 [Dactylella cylindrospora]|nr:hypothetical protein ABW19_dt0204135 [Dactylella cylindrospora]
MSSVTKPTTSYPLTTLFEPPESCFTNYWLPTVLGTAFPGAVFINGPPIAASGATTSCWPKDYTIVGDTSATFYSPGICPSGYITASQSYISKTMYAYCCMDGFELLPDQLPPDLLPESINKDDFTRASNTKPICYQALQTPILVTYNTFNGEEYTTDLRKGFSVIQFPIKVKYELTDFSKFPLDAQPTNLPAEAQEDLEPFIRSGLTIASQTSRKTSATGTTSPPTGTETLPAETSDSASGDNLDGNTKTIAISVGVTVSVVIVLALVGYIIFAHKRKKKLQAGGSYPQGSGPYRQHQNNDSHIGGIQDYPDQTGGIALAEAGDWHKSRQ